MFEKLRQNDDFRNHERARRFFIQLLLVTLKFVINCDNAQDSRATAYMFTKPGDEPLENAIQADYMNALRLSNLSRFCVPEPQGVGGGRADVHFSYCAYHLVTECKRNFENRTNKLALDAYGAQLVAYQVSSLTFSALLILDLYDRAGSVQNIRDRSAQRIERFPASRPAHRTIHGWALSVLLDAHAIRECEEHGHMKDRTDPHALHHAREVARQEPFPGTSPDQSVAAIDDVMRSIGDTCPECG